MSKSEGEDSTIYFTDEPAAIKKKIMRAKTDSGPTQENQTKPQEIENLFNLMRAVSSPDTVEYFDGLYNRCQIRYGDMKKQLVEDMNAFIEPFRSRIVELEADTDRLNRIMDIGKEKAQASAQRTLREIRKVIGYRD